MIFAVVAAVGVWAQVRTAVVVGVLVLQALLSEVVQGAVLANRSAEWGDLVADLAGIGLGIALGRGLGRRATRTDAP